MQRLAIVNRSEPAVRVIHAVRELEQADPQGRVTIALHTEAERSAMFVREADEAVRIGPEAGSAGAGNPYLDYDELERALRASRADAAWVGWGFVAEHPEFAELCERLGITFVGPPGAVMRRLGDKIAAKRLAEEAGVPVAPWSGGPVEDLAEAREHAQRIGLPLAVKAAAGGGGRGIRMVHAPEELDAAVTRAREEAASAFGDPRVFLERVVADAHHVEVQVVADAHGTVWPVGIRDCSTQRRNQKILEESGAPSLSSRQQADLCRAAADLARAAGYRGAGTVEFLHSPDEDLLAFLEVNTRLQVEHPVTELVTGLDLVKLQLHLAAGGRLEGEPPPALGHAVEARLNAEDPERDFAPAPGAIELLTLPAGPGVRVDRGVAEGDVIPPEYDSMIAKVLAWGRDRDEALARLGRALSQTTVLVRGGTTNRAFLLGLLSHPRVVQGTVTTGWLDAGGTAEVGQPASRPDVALAAAAIESFEDLAEVERSRFLSTAARGRPEATTDIGRDLDLRHGAHHHRVTVAQTGPSRYRVTEGDHAATIDVERLGRLQRRLTVGTDHFRVASITHGAERLLEVDGVPHRVSQDDAGVVRTPGPGLLMSVTVAEGDEVEAGSAVAVMESMKMETALTAPFSGRVREVLATSNLQLEAGTPVVRLEPLASDAGDADATDGADLSLLAKATRNAAETDPVRRARSDLDALRRALLGYDVAPELATEVVEDLERTARPEDGDDAETLDAEIAILALFGDLASLSRNRRLGDEEDRAEERAAREHLHELLRSPDLEAERLPESFRSKLRRALSHYGVHDLDRTPALEEALYRIHLAQQRVSDHLPIVLGLLERRLRAGCAPPDERGRALRRTLDRLIRATQVRHPAVGDLARRARHRCFEQPRLDREREEAHERVRSHLAALTATPHAPDRDERMQAMVTTPQPLLPLLGEALEGAHDLTVTLEALTRRYYRARQLHAVRAVSPRGRPAVVADVTDRRGRGLVAAVAAPRAEAAEALRAAHEATRDEPPELPGLAVADLYLSWPEAPEDADALAAEIAPALEALPADTRLRRVTVSVLPDARHRGRHLTFRRDDDGGFSERDHLRDIHPLIAGRLNLWRFQHFSLTRLPSTEDVYLFRCVARENPDDERLVAMAEVRDLTPVRDGDGRIASLPEIERVFAACVADLRQARAAYPARRQPDWNRVVLYVVPPVDVPVADLDPVIRGLAPLTEDLGLEQVLVQARLADADGGLREVVARLSRPPGQRLTLRLTDPPDEPLQPLDALTQRMLRARRRGTLHPAELAPLLTRRPDAAPEQAPEGHFVEHDLDAHGRLEPVARPLGDNHASVVVGTVATPTDRYPEGMERVAILGDPTKGLGSLAEAECRRIIAALDLADQRGLPVEWFAVSSGARIAMDSGTENMDWVAAVLRRIVTFTQDGGEINVVVTGINVGAQPYWNAEATMLMHTRGILVMTPASAMVLTGKRALDYSGGVSAEDNFGIGGYDRVMGPNGQAQHWAPDIHGALEVLFAHYDHAYVAPGERFPRPAVTTDPADRDVRPYPHAVEGSDFTRVGEILSPETNPDRKRPFDIRTVLHAVRDQDHEPLERWAGMADAETAVVFDAHLGGRPVTLLGFESRPLPRRGLLPADGPDQWTAGTLFPQSSKKTARALNAASGVRPAVVVANLSGFDGSPESLRELQLEYGAEIGRAVVNFDGPIVFCVISRYHGGAFVVFSGALNEDLEVAAVEGSHASVIGGSPAAAVVFSGEVRNRTEHDPRVRELEERRARAGEVEAAQLQAELDALRPQVRSERLAEVAAEFDAVHSVERARDVGSVHQIIPPERLRPFLVEAVERGVARAVQRAGPGPRGARRR